MSWRPIKAFLARRKRRRLRHVMRGYHRLKSADQLDRIAIVKDALTVGSLQLSPGRAERFFLGCAAPHAEQSARQQLLMRIGSLSLNESLLRSIGNADPVTHPLPKQWRETLRQHGFAVADVRSTLAWWGFVGLMAANGVLVICKHVALGLRQTLRRGSRSPVTPYAFFDALSPGNLPQPVTDGVSHDVVSWYASWQGRHQAVKELRHGVGAAPTSVNGLPVVFGGAAVTPLGGCGQMLRYLGWAVAAAGLALLGLLQGRWSRALLLAEAATAAVVRLQGPQRLARDYLFHNSSWINRRPWTFEAENHGARILFYFYSANCEGFKTPKGYPPPLYGYRAMNWSRYLVWDEAHADFVRRTAGASANASIVGSIWFNAGAAALPDDNGAPSIAVFDVVPTRDSYYVTLGLDTEYYVPRVNFGFLRDIHDVAQDRGFRLYWKRKRKMAPNTHNAYRRFAPEFARLDGVCSIDPNIAAHRLIAHCDLAISMPFTSTAIIARELGKPSCYYDPTGQLQPDDRAAHGIPIVQGRSALAAWVRQHTAAPSQRARTISH